MSQQNFATLQNFKPENIIAGDTRTFERPAGFKRMYLKYKYENDRVGNFIIRTRFYCLLD